MKKIIENIAKGLYEKDFNHNWEYSGVFRECYMKMAEFKYELDKMNNRVEISEFKSGDNINPNHYKVGGIETWDYLKAKLTPTELAGSAKFNVIKYVSRCDHKGKLEDLKKAKWYLDKIIEEIEKNEKV